MTTTAKRIWQVMVVASLLGAWAIAASQSLIVRDVVGDPFAVVTQLFRLVGSGEIFRHLAVTVEEAVIGFSIGAVLGAAVAFVLTFVPFLRRLFDPLIGIIAVVPRIVLAPVFMVWFGLGISSKAAMVATIVFFIVYFNVDAGLRSVSGLLIDRARIMGADKFAMTREIYIPASVVWILSGLRVSVGFAFLGAIVAEYLGANAGIGSLIATAQSLNDPNAVMAGLVVVLVVVVPLDRVLTVIEARTTAWRGT
ncbi:MAG TPA: ABC transporter permease [Pseudolabrys sp.]|jgi:NitT/TauT family transport system permease protein|nr:ABC transporter permease [Pseudolabrys sp.]